MEADASKARDLELKLEAGQHILELDPNLIDSSFIKDRISVEDDAEFDVFVKGIAEQGQQVPYSSVPAPLTPGAIKLHMVTGASGPLLDWEFLSGRL